MRHRCLVLWLASLAGFTLGFKSLLTLMHKPGGRPTQLHMMGGRALKVTKTRRLRPEEYQAVKADVLSRLRAENHIFVRVDTPHEAPEKADYGDLDVLYIPVREPPLTGREIPDAAKRLFGASEVLINGDVTSFDYRGCFQVDLIKCRTHEEWDSHLAYLSYGDVGIMLGHVAVKNGLKYGHLGLWTVVREQDDKGKWMEMKITLTTHIREIYELFGLDHDRWLQGFTTREQVFEWLAYSPYVRLSIFRPEDSVKLAAKNKQRPSQAAFCAYIQERSEKYPPERPRMTQDHVVARFSKQDELQAARAAIALQRERARKFSGRLFLPLGERNVGHHLHQFRSSIIEEQRRACVEETSDDDRALMDCWIDSTDADEIQRRVSAYIAQVNLAEGDDAAQQ